MSEKTSRVVWDFLNEPSENLRPLTSDLFLRTLKEIQKLQAKEGMKKVVREHIKSVEGICEKVEQMGERL